MNTSVKPLNATSIIVCEATGRWAAALKRELPREVSLVETRSLPELWQRLADSPAALVALELTAPRCEQVVSALVQIGRKFPRATSVVLADRLLASWEDGMREAGAIHFVASPRRVREVAEVARHRMHVAPAVESTTDEQEIEQRILASLPWGD